MATQIQSAIAKPKDRSGTITEGTTAQELMPSNTGRGGFWVQNLSEDNLWLSEIGTAAASQPSLLVPPGSLYETPVTGCTLSAISIYGATTGQAFSAREWTY